MSTLVGLWDTRVSFPPATTLPLPVRDPPPTLSGSMDTFWLSGAPPMLRKIGIPAPTWPKLASR